jgi:hypothetical protein
MARRRGRRRREGDREPEAETNKASTIPAARALTPPTAVPIKAIVPRSSFLGNATGIFADALSAVATAPAAPASRSFAASSPA